MSFSTRLLSVPSLSWWRRFWFRVQPILTQSYAAGGNHQRRASPWIYLKIFHWLKLLLSDLNEELIFTMWSDPASKFSFIWLRLCWWRQLVMTRCRREETGRFIFVHNITSLNCTFPLRPSSSTSPLSAWLERMQMPGRRKLCWQCEVEPVFSVVCNSMWNVIIPSHDLHSLSYTQ